MSRILRSLALRVALLLLAPAFVLLPTAAHAGTTQSQGFDSWPVTGWTVKNNSEPVGTTSWFAGSTSGKGLAPHAGADFAAADFNATANTGTISDWLISPKINGLNSGDAWSFFTRTEPASSYPDRMEFRVSTDGSCDPGTGSSSVGDFTTLLTSVNTTLTQYAYPENWTQFSGVLSGLTGMESGCFAFRYWVSDGGLSGSNSDFVGVDDFSYTAATSDTTAPTVTINQDAAQADPTSSGPVLFQVVFSEPVTGFTGSDVSLSGTAGAMTATVNGTGTTYAVQVSGMTGPGTVIASVPAGAAVDAANNPSAASTSTDNSVTYQAAANPTCFGVPATIVGTAGNDTLTGTSGADVIVGLGGNDTISGGGGADKICAGSGNDVINGGAGSDRIAGESGSDTVTYAGRSDAIVANLTGGTGDDGGSGDGAAGARDTIGTDVENLIGGNASDSLKGNGSANRLSGGPGNDTLVGGAGRDQLNGGTGVDTVSYAGRSDVIVANLSGGTGDDGGSGDGAAGARDTIASDVENLIGGKAGDTLKGNSVANRLTGGPGADRLYGLGGKDYLNAKDGVRDIVLNGGTGTDAGSFDAIDPARISVP